MVDLLKTGPCEFCEDIDIDLLCCKYTNEHGLVNHYSLQCRHEKICVKLVLAGELKEPKRSRTSGG